MSTEIAVPGNTAEIENKYAAETGLAEFTKSSTFHPRLKLINFSSDEVKHMKAAAKDYVLKVSKDEVKVLGQTVVVKPLAFRYTALDFREDKKVKRYHDPRSSEFQEVKRVADVKPAGGGLNPCTAGVEFLFATQDHGLVTVLCGTTSWKQVAAAIEGIRKQNGFLTLGSKLVTGKFTYLAPTVAAYPGGFEVGDVFEAAKAFADADAAVEEGDDAASRDR